MANEFDYEKLLSNPIAALGIGLLSTNNSRDAIKATAGLLGQAQEYKRNKVLDRLTESQIKKLEQDGPYDLPTGYRWNPETSSAEGIPGIDPSYLRKSDPLSMPIQVYNPQTDQLEFVSRANASAGGYLPPKSATPKPNLTQSQVPGYDIVGDAFPTKKNAEDMKAIIEADINLRRLLGASDNIVSAKGTELFGEDADRLKQNYEMQKIQIKNLEDLGAIQTPDIPIIEGMIPNPASRTENVKSIVYDWDNSSLRGRIKALQDEIDSRVKTRAEVLGYKRSSRPPANSGAASVGAPAAPESGTAIPKAIQDAMDEQSAASGPRVIVKTQISPSTGKRKIIYSDGTEEIR